MELITLLIIFFSGVVFGWMWHAKSMLGRIMRDPDTMIDMLEKYKKTRALEELPKDIRPIRVEKHGSALYLYAKDTNEFLAQGSTLQEALEIIEKRFPGQNFKGHLSKEEADSLGINA